MEDVLDRFKKSLEEELENLLLEFQKLTYLACAEMSKYIKETDNLEEKIYHFLIQKYKINENIEKKYMIIEDLLKIMNFNPETKSIYFVEFNYLWNFLDKFNFSNKERMIVVNYLLEKDVEILDRRPLIIDQNHLEQLNLSPKIQKQFLNYICSSNFNIEILFLPEEQLTSSEKLFKSILEDYIEMDCVVDPKVTALEVVKRHFLDKGELNEKDVKITTKAFEILNIPKEYCEYFKAVKLNEIEKQKRKKINNSLNNKSNTRPHVVTNKVNNQLSKKEYNHIFREIMSLYDIQEQKVIKPLKLEEIIYLISLMYKINISKNEIMKCIKVINKEALNAYKNPLSKFIDYYNKMLFYSDNEEIKKSLNAIVEYMQELYIPQDQESYGFWKNAIADEMENITPVLNKYYEYELVEGNKRNV